MSDKPSSIRQYGVQIREGRLQIADVVENYLKKIKERNDELNIVVKSFDDEAQSAAEALEGELRQGKDRGPMHGVPIAVKDIFSMAGCVPTAGSGAEIRCGDNEAAVVRRLKASGAIILGALNLDEFAAGGTGANLWHGRCKNPLILGESQEVLRVVARQQSVPVFVWRLSDQMRVDQSGFLRRFVEFTG